MAKIIWMSDPHFQNQGTIDGLDPRMRLEAAIMHMNSHNADADCIILSGDLVGDDIAGDYSLLSEYLAKSDIPVYPMIGNNDDRNELRKSLTFPASTMPDFIQYIVDTPAGKIVCLDTHKPGSAAGQFCTDRQTWLNQTLIADRDRPVYIFMHHPPMPLGLPLQDDIMLDEGERFLDILGQHNNVKHLFMGHVHRPTCGTIRDIPFATIGAISFQAPAPSPAWNWDSFVAPKEAPHYGVLYIEHGNVTLQYTQFCTYETGIEN